MNSRCKYHPTGSFLVIVVLIWSTEAAKVQLPPNMTVTAVITFGDSIVDTGNNNENALSFARANFPPYGKDFLGHVATGRFCNGKVPSDFIVESLGIKELLPPYADPNLKPADLLTGVCFAVGGAGYDPMTSQIASIPPITDQLAKFKEYIGKLNAIAGAEKTKFIISNSMVFVVLSSNDIATTYFTVPGRSLQYDVSSYCDFLVSAASDFFKQLYGLGVRRLGVIGAPPIGCVPAQRTFGGGVERHCNDQQNEAAKLFNSKLSGEIDRLDKQFPDANMVYVDIYSLLDDMVKSPTKYGFKVADKGCCGTGIIEVGPLCTPAGTTCMDDNSYIFWDSFHPTERAYQVLIDQIIVQYFDKFLKR